MDVFKDAARHIQSEPIKEWKKKGKKAVGYTCSHLPAEIFYAADILPVRLRGLETDGMEIGDAYYGPFICSFPKCILQLAGKGMYSFLDGAVITPGCDAMRRLDECWRKAGEDHAGIVPPYFYYFDVPHKAEPHGMDWFAEEIRKLIKSVEAHFQVIITDANLKKAIAVYNRGRRLLGSLEGMRRKDQLKITGTEAFAAIVAGTVLPRDAYTQQLEKWSRALEEKADAGNGKKRLMLVGSISDDIDLVELIEKNMDAVVVAENLCFGVRSGSGEVSEEGDPVEALARFYLGSSVCPRMYGKYKQRLAILQETIDRVGVDGVVMQNIRFCDLHGAENALLERDMEAAGIPCLRVEREYGPLTETGRMKLRLNAFLERIA